MSRVVIIGGSGHVGTYLVPRLVEAGFEVCNVTRGERQPYLAHGAWKAVQTVVIDREAEEKAGTFGRAMRNLKADIIIDMICFTPESARQMVEALNGHVGHFLHCGTIWVHGPSVAVPTTEMQPRRPFGDYGVRKAAIEAYLLDEARRNRFPGDRPPSRPHRRRGLEPAEPGRPFRPQGLLHAGARRGTGAAQSRHGDRPPCPRRRRGTGLHEGDRQLARVGRRGLPCRLAGGRDAAGATPKRPPAGSAARRS